VSRRYKPASERTKCRLFVIASEAKQSGLPLWIHS
jgi:hypothetical protein